MKFFNLDLHISVIGDIKHILENLGHSVESWSISGHAHVMGKKVKDVEIINQHTWRNLTPELADKFYERYKNELDGYDGFIVTHTPCFSMLYEKFNKPIIVVASTRYEDPFSNDYNQWTKFNKYLKKGIDSGMIIPIANNKYDKKYVGLFTNREWTHIPSLCEYTQSKYTGINNKFLYCSKFKQITKINNLVDKDFMFRGGYKWQDLADLKGIVHIPYNVSTMSIFEHYTSNIPLFFPTHRFINELRKTHWRNGVLSEISWNQILGYPLESLITIESNDPNNMVDKDSMFYWSKLSDFYDEENMPHIVHFDSFPHLNELLISSKLKEISEAMAAHNIKRKEMVYNKWSTIVENLEK